MRPRGSSTVVLALAVAALAGDVTADGGSACLGPNVGQAIQDLVRSHAFDAPRPAGFRLERLDVMRDHIEIEYHDAAGDAAMAVLAVRTNIASAANGDGGTPNPLNFEPRVVSIRGDLPEATRAAILRDAALVDRAVPREDVRACETDGAMRNRHADEAPRASRWLGLLLGAGQIAVVLFALVWGTFALRAPPEPREPPGRAR